MQTGLAVQSDVGRLARISFKCAVALCHGGQERTIVAASSYKAKYNALACNEVARLPWLIATLLSFGCSPALKVACDNEGTATNAQKESIHRHIKHLDIAYDSPSDASNQSNVSYKVVLHKKTNRQSDETTRLGWVSESYGCDGAAQKLRLLNARVQCWREVRV